MRSVSSPFKQAINSPLDLNTDRILGVEVAPARFSAEAAAARTLITRAKAKLGIAPFQFAADKACGNSKRP